MKIVGNRPTTIECRNKSKYAGADLQRWTKRYRVVFARNPNSKSFDFAELDRGALAAIEDGRGAEYVTAVFAAIWGRPEDLSHADTMIAKLESETKAAAERGVFGAPTMFVGDQMYFGNDRLDFVAEALRSAT
jgi:2-hydroxychromene-2-carboxylate isomerase